MKYAKEWKHLVSQMPSSFQEVCLDYKQWKKRCKHMNINEAIVLLGSECNKVDDAFNNSYQVWRHPPSFLACLTKRVHPTNPQTLLLFAQANAKTVYKVCKRLQKTKEDPTPMKWLTSVRAAHEYSFLGGHHTAHLQLCECRRPIECPICLETVSHKNMLVYQCGHNACVSCTLQYAKVQERGLWYNLLPYAKRRDCPYCHFEKAFLNATTVR